MQVNKPKRLNSAKQLNSVPLATGSLSKRQGFTAPSGRAVSWTFIHKNGGSVQKQKHFPTQS